MGLARVRLPLFSSVFTMSMVENTNTSFFLTSETKIRVFVANNVIGLESGL